MGGIFCNIQLCVPELVFLKVSTWFGARFQSFILFKKSMTISEPKGRQACSLRGGDDTDFLTEVSLGERRMFED